MVEKTVTVQNVSGLDMQTAAMIAENSGRFQADIYLQQGSMRANAKSVMGVMMLAAGVIVLVLLGGGLLLGRGRNA